MGHLNLRVTLRILKSLEKPLLISQKYSKKQEIEIPKKLVGSYNKSNTERNFRKSGRNQGKVNSGDSRESDRINVLDNEVAHKTKSVQIDKEDAIDVERNDQNLIHAELKRKSQGTRKDESFDGEERLTSDIKNEDTNEQSERMDEEGKAFSSSKARWTFLLSME